MKIYEDSYSETELKSFEDDLRFNGLVNRSFLSFRSTDPSFDPDDHREKRIISDPSSSEDVDFTESVKKSRFFVHTNSKEIEESVSNNNDFILNASPKASDYLPPNIYKPAYLYKKYKYSDLFRLEILNVFLYTFLTTNGQISCILLKLPSHTTYFLRVFIHTISLLFSMLLCGNEETFRSINITLEFTMINAILFNYTFLDIFIYFSIQIVIGFFTNLMVFGLFYKLFSKPSMFIAEQLVYFSHEKSTQTLINANTSLINATIGLAIMVIVITQIVDAITSIEYKKVISYKLLVFFLFNGVLSISVNSMFTSSYNISTLMAITLLKLESTSIAYSNYFVLYSSFLFISVSLLSAWIGFYHIKNYYHKYIEI